VAFSDQGKKATAAVLGNLAVGNAANAAAIVQAGAIPLLVDMLCGGESAEGKESAAEALYNLTSIDTGRYQVEGLGYTQARLRKLQAERIPG
jgi:hypothetical protein